jgi:hypothetical protein
MKKPVQTAVSHRHNLSLRDRGPSAGTGTTRRVPTPIIHAKKCSSRTWAKVNPAIPKRSLARSPTRLSGGPVLEDKWRERKDLSDVQVLLARSAAAGDALPP